MREQEPKGRRSGLEALAGVKGVQSQAKEAGDHQEKVQVGHSQGDPRVGARAVRGKEPGASPSLPKLTSSLDAESNYPHLHPLVWKGLWR